MMIRSFVFDQKRLEVLLYVARRCRDLYLTMKVHFLADKKHLTRYGRLISGDRYVAMTKGPVPSGAYDIVHVARRDPGFLPDERVTEALSVEGNDLKTLRAPDMDYLSSSDRECLDEAIVDVRRMSRGELWRLLHDDPAYKAAARNKPMSLRTLVNSLPDGEQIWEYLADC